MLHLNLLHHFGIDPPLLIDYFSKTISKAYNLKDLNIDKEDSYLMNHFWPGNVRELRNLIERIAILSNNDQNKIKTIIKESIKQEENEVYSEINFSVPLQNDFKTTTNAQFLGKQTSKVVIDKKIPYMDAIVWYCERNEMEVEVAAKLLNGIIKAKIEEIKARSDNPLGN